MGGPHRLIKYYRPGEINIDYVRDITCIYQKNISSKYDSRSTNSRIQEIVCCLIFFFKNHLKSFSHILPGWWRDAIPSIIWVSKFPGCAMVLGSFILNSRWLSELLSSLSRLLRSLSSNGLALPVQHLSSSVHVLSAES